MDYGPFISHTFQLPNNNITLRGIAVPFDAPIEGEKVTPGAKGKPAFDPAKCGVIFDTELLRYSGWWNGGFITWTGVVFNGNHGANPEPVGKVRIATKQAPGWAFNGKFDDPRPIPHGPLPREWGRYKGLYRSDKGIVFSYTVGDVQVLDMPGVEVHDNRRFFVRTISVGASRQPMSVVLADLPGVKMANSVGSTTMIDNGQDAVVANVAGGPIGTKIGFGQNAGGDPPPPPGPLRLAVEIPASDKPSRVVIALWSGLKTDWDWRQGLKAWEKIGQPIDLTPLTKGGKARFTETVTTQGKRGDDKTAYTVDSLTPPFKNPYKSWMRFGGFDFFSDGRAAVSTWSGDVWIVSGIDDGLQNLKWKRYAAGLFHALGLKIVDDKVYVLGRDQITRLHDLNGDGEADFYECFNNDAMITTNFHEFTFDLQTDKDGNFYFVKGGPVRPGGSGWDKITPHHGCLFKVSKDGAKLEVVARGFRAPNGMGIGPNGELTVGDNEGTWTPTCPINWIKPGGFYGVPDFAGKPKTDFPKVRDNPLCWLPHDDVDNSNGGQVWITGDKFGPLSGQLLHSSYGRSKLYLVMKEEVAGQMQGGVYHLPVAFDSGICRARFREAENALYLTGLRGWQTNAAKDAGLYRMRYTGKKANMPIDLKVRAGQVAITFTDPLDRASATDADGYTVRHWNYRWTSNYGSAHYLISDPKKQAKKNAEEEVEVQSASVSPDGKTVTLKIDKLQPVMQMKIQYNLKAADGTKVQSAIWNTINVVGNLRGEVHVGEYRIVEMKK
jgi:glucose/arabinose dehydrogenase